MTLERELEIARRLAELETLIPDIPLTVLLELQKIEKEMKELEEA